MVLLLWVLGVSGCHGQAPDTLQADSQLDSILPPAEVSFVFTGDIMQHDSQIADALLPDGAHYDYGYCFSLLKPYLEAADFTVGNLEVTFGGKPYKGYPTFSAPDTLAYTLRDVGFDALVTVNNHCLDKGQKGVKRTLQVLDSAGLLHVGTYLDSAAHQEQTPLILQKDTIKIALLAYTYGTNGIKNRGPAVVNYIDTVQMAQELALARSQAHAVIVAMHWGNEYQSYPSKQQMALSAWLWQHGATLVMGNHPHVVQPLEIGLDSAGRMSNLTMYALGNFVSAQRTYPRAGGMVLRCKLVFGQEQPYIADAEYLLTYTERPVGQLKPRYRILPLWNDSADTLTNDRSQYVRKFMDDTEFLLRAADSHVLPLHSLEPLQVDSVVPAGVQCRPWRFQKP